MENQELIELKSDSDLLLTKATEVAQIGTVEHESRAVEFLAQTKRRFKLVDTKFKEYTKPLKDSINAMKADFDPIKDSLNEAERIVKQGIKTFRDSEDFKQKERERIETEELSKQVVREIAKGEITDDSLEMYKESVEMVSEATKEAPKTVTTESGQARYRKDWKFEIETPIEVPTAYCSPDPKLIKEAVKNGVRNIQGVRIWEETIPIIMS